MGASKSLASPAQNAFPGILSLLPLLPQFPSLAMGMCVWGLLSPCSAEGFRRDVVVISQWTYICVHIHIYICFIPLSVIDIIFPFSSSFEYEQFCKHVQFKTAI